MPTPEQLKERPFFDASKLPIPKVEYVAWFDVVGTQSHLTQSHHRAANFFAKIHLVALACQKDSVHLYPVMDGIYVTCPSKKVFLKFTHDFFRLLCINFCGEGDCKHRFSVRGSFAFGAVTHGNRIPEPCAKFEQTNYRDSLLIGMPMIQAYQVESLAPPFGCFIHESARSFAESEEMPFSGRWLRWWWDEDEPLIAEMRVALPEYFSWAEGHAQEFDYPVAKISEHRALAYEYFQIS